MSVSQVRFSHAQARGPDPGDRSCPRTHLPGRLLTRSRLDFVQRRRDSHQRDQILEASRRSRPAEAFGHASPLLGRRPRPAVRRGSVETAGHFDDFQAVLSIVGSDRHRRVL